MLFNQVVGRSAFGKSGRRRFSHSLNLGAVDRRIQSPLATAFEVHMTLERLRVPSSALCVFSRIVRVSALVLIGLSLSAAQESPAVADDKGSIHGTVTSQAGAIVADAKVVLTGTGGARLAVPVNAKGEYSVTGLFPGTYMVTVSAVNFADLVFDNVTLAPGRKLTLDATLKPPSAKPAVEPSGAEQVDQSAAPAAKTIAGDKGAISGTVTDQTGAVVVDAKAVLTSVAGAKLETQVNEKGAYSFSGLEPGTYKLVVTATNFADMPFDNVVVTAGLE